MVDLEKIRELVRMMVDNDLVEVSLRDGEEEVNLKRPGHAGPPVQTVAPALAAPAEVSPPQGTAPTASAPETQAPSEGAPEDNGLVAIRSPMVGTFYRSPNPESPSYVDVGSRVTQDSVVCIVEAMKVFNEIKAEIAGTIERVLVENQDPVEYGQDLFMVRPA